MTLHFHTPHPINYEVFIGFIFKYIPNQVTSLLNYFPTSPLDLKSIVNTMACVLLSHLKCHLLSETVLHLTSDCLSPRLTVSSQYDLCSMKTRIFIYLFIFDSYRLRKSKAAPDIQNLAWYSHLGMSVLLSNLHNFTELQHQTRPFCDYYGLKQKQGHSIFMSEHSI